jgi:hypothetical protein
LQHVKVGNRYHYRYLSLLLLPLLLRLGLQLLL